MAQAVGGYRLRRMEFSFKGQSFVFHLNPEEYSMSEPNRVTITETLAGAFLDSFGQGLQEISLKGTTGVRGNGATQSPTYGFDQFKKLRDLIRKSYGNINDGRYVSDEDMVKFYNYTDEEYFYVVVTNFSLSRSRSKPLLFQYDIKMTVIKPLNAPSYTAEKVEWNWDTVLSNWGAVVTSMLTPMSTMSSGALEQITVAPMYNPTSLQDGALVTGG